MKKILFIYLFAFAFVLPAYTQMVQLHYSGSNLKIKESVTEANRILSSQEFYNRIDTIQKFDNTLYNGHQIMLEMKLLKTVEITEYFKRNTLTTAKTQTKIRLNTAKLHRSIASIVKTLVHESVHATDWLVNKRWDYTHKTQHVEAPPVSAPYVIGSIAMGMVNL